MKINLRRKVQIIYCLLNGEEVDFTKKVSFISFVKELTFIRQLYLTHSTLKKRITRTKGVIGGRPAIKGTRISPEVITDYFFSNIFLGYQPEDAIKLELKGYPSLTREDIIAALCYSFSF